MEKTKFAFFGAGFWARYQMAAWKEIPEAECVALYNRTLPKGQAFAEEFGVGRVYDDPIELLEKEKIDFIDLCTNPFTLPGFVELAAKYRIPVITQKPIAPSLEIAERCVKLCAEAGIPYLVHENWRWQKQIRKLKEILDSGQIGEVFRARLRMVSGFNVYRNEPTLVDLEKFVITDVGTHILDTARFLFGEAETLYCQTGRIHPDIKGEDVATILMAMGLRRSDVIIELGYAENFLKDDAFSQTFALIEGDKGSIALEKDYKLYVTTRAGTRELYCPPDAYPWADPDYYVIHSSIVACNRHLLGAILGEHPAETTVEDHLNTVRLTYAAYDSAGQGTVIRFY
jgi:predicted dehydrogenase